MKAKPEKKKESKKQLILDRLKDAMKKSEFTEVFVWGNNDKGQLGFSNKPNEPLSYILEPKTCSFNIMISEIGKQIYSILLDHSHFVA